jgi:sterol 24-C-methyltransferase
MSPLEKSEAPGLAELLATAGDGRVEKGIDDYLAHHRSGGKERQAGYAALVNDYFDLATDFYEYGWGQSFHFARQVKGESFAEAIFRHEARLAARLGLRPGMTVLDVGCGIGGPMRNIARIAGCAIVGVNNNAYQLRRAERLNAEAELATQCRVVPGDFMAMPFADASLDAAYAIEATVHAPNWAGVFDEVFRCLKPGASFALYDWCLTGAYDDRDPQHRALKRGIVEGNGLVDIGTSAQLLRSLGKAGFEVVEQFDAAGGPGLPWYEPLAPSGISFAGFRSSGIGRKVTNVSLRLLELARVVPKGAADVAVFLDRAAIGLVAGGRTGIFTPMFFVHARKPG